MGRDFNAKWWDECTINVLAAFMHGFAFILPQKNTKSAKILILRIL
jgi:hypothetical protein